VPRLDSDIAACAFAERCRHAVPRCRLEMPPLLAREGGHSVACWETDRVIAEAGMEDR
jgi:ABC-type dipeptide/oligopeptide/nickel transport system ATPase component